MTNATSSKAPRSRRKAKQLHFMPPPPHPQAVPLVVFPPNVAVATARVVTVICQSPVAVADAFPLGVKSPMPKNGATHIAAVAFVAACNLPPSASKLPGQHVRPPALARTSKEYEPGLFFVLGSWHHARLGSWPSPPGWPAGVKLKVLRSF